MYIIALGTTVSGNFFLLFFLSPSYTTLNSAFVHSVPFFYHSIANCCHVQYKKLNFNYELFYCIDPV